MNCRDPNVAILLSDGLSARGGIGRITAYLVRELARSFPGIQIAVYRARYTDRAVAKHLTVPLALTAFIIRLAMRRIDVAHINVAPRGSTWRKLLFARTAGRLGIPVIIHLHGSGYDEFYASLSSKRQASARGLFRDAAAVVALSDYWRRFVVDTLGVAPDRVVEIPNGVPAAQGPFERPEAGAPHILFLGVLGERKGTDVLIDALASLKAEGLTWRATLGGNGEVEVAQARAARLRIADQIAFTGWVGEEDVDALMRAADIFVLPSRAENQPVAILEAMARGLPVVATRIGAIPEQVADGETGILVPPGDAFALAEALGGLIRSHQARLRMGAAGRERFNSHFAIAACAQRFAGLYRAIARSGKP